VRALSLYYKNIAPDEIAIVAPAKLGGLKSKEYLAKNPLGLMPMLILSENDEAIPESDTIARYLCSAFASRGPELAPSSPVAAARVDKICRLHDVYIAPIQGALYKAPGANVFPPFGRFATRRAAIEEIVTQVKALETMVAPYGGPYLCGPTPTAADCALFPTCCFLMKMLPKFDVATQDAFGPKLSQWWAFMSKTDAGEGMERLPCAGYRALGKGSVCQRAFMYSRSYLFASRPPKSNVPNGRRS
jgi:glutathione S-transferase